ncbi:uncharacterized protein LOC133910534 [Phragmites australis]|uniref:uncharacterized protein LOC133910534 n=1 Tax=Phragmites australis TaxID=29695 RepID=UPI002D766082|nr:uncharacterized protein LOC133910534 [Phragmites australis]
MSEKGAAGSPTQTDGSSATGCRPQASGAGAAGSRPQAGRGAATGSSRQAGGGGAAGSGAVIVPGDKGKHPRIFVPTSTSLSSLSPLLQWPPAGGAKEGGRGGQQSGARPATEAASTVLEPDLDLLGLDVAEDGASAVLEPGDQGRHSSGSTTSAQADPPPAMGTRALEPRDQGRHGSARTVSAQADPPPETDPATARRTPAEEEEGGKYRRPKTTPGLQSS